MNTPPYPRYYVQPFYSRDNPSTEPAGWDVWEQTGLSVAAVVIPCDTEEEANAECARLKAEVAQSLP